jgi:hypothetical protein
MGTEEILGSRKTTMRGMDSVRRPEDNMALRVVEEEVGAIVFVTETIQA